MSAGENGIGEGPVPLRPKPPVPLWRWAIWWLTLGAALVVFYVVLTPVWVGLRAAAWLAEFRARRRPAEG